MSFNRGLLTISIFFAALAIGAQAAEPLRPHPENPRYFLFRGEPTVFVTSGEHYGAVLNLDFDYVRYLDALQADGLNNTRTFAGTYREIPGSFNIAENTLAPMPNRYICPWARSATPGYFDGGNKFDLTRWDPDYFLRLKDFMTQASRRGVLVELDLFCPNYNDNLWRANPMNAANNVNGIGKCSAKEVYTLKHKDLLAVQEAVTRKIVTELRDFDNLYYEICNEPYFGGVTMEWQHRIIDVIVQTEKQFVNKHLISLNVANGRARVDDPHPAVSLFNFHYCHPPDVVAMNAHLNTPIGENETGFRGRADVTYRTEGWDFILAGGALYNNLDYSFTVKCPDGTRLDAKAPGGGSPSLRKQLKILKDFLYGFDFIHMSPDSSFVKAGLPPKATARALTDPGKQYAVYVHGGTKADLQVALPEGTYAVQWMNPTTGKTDKSEALQHPGGIATLLSPPYKEDVALSIVNTEKDTKPPSIEAVYAVGETALSITFSERLDHASATTPGNYSVDQNLSVLGSELKNGGRTVSLRTSPMKAGGKYRLTVRKLADCATPPNAIPGHLQEDFSFDGRSLYRAINLGGPSLVIDGCTWEGCKTPDFSFKGRTFENQGVVLDPDPGSAMARMIRSSIWEPGGSNIKLARVPNGSYKVFLYVWEDNASQTFDIFLNGTRVQQQYSSGKGGHWDKLGPWMVKVTEGTIALHCSRADANLSGIEIWRQ